MTTTTFDRGALRVTTGHAIRSELLKLTTLRSTWVTAGALALLVATIGILGAATAGSSAGSLSADDALQLTLGGTGLAVLFVGALGALAGAREHASGMIRTTVSAVPQRSSILLAKVTALSLVLASAVTVGIVTSVVVGSALLRGAGAPTLALTDGTTLQAVGGSIVYLTGVALIGLGVGVLLRNVAGAITAVVGVVLLLPEIAGALLPASWGNVLEFLPSSAGQAVMTTTSSTTLLTPGVGLAVFLGWVLVILGAAEVALNHRDA